MTLYRVIGRDTGIPSLNDSALAGAAFGAIVDLTLTAGVEAELIDAGLIEFVHTPTIQYVSSYGAVGDGVSDDTAAIQAAFDDASALGTSLGRQVVVVIPPGTYLTDVVVPKSNIDVWGYGAVIKKRRDSLSGQTTSCLWRTIETLTGATYYGTYRNITLRGLTFDGNGKTCGNSPTFAGTMLRFYYVENLVMKDVTVSSYSPNSWAMGLGGSGSLQGIRIRGGSLIYEDGIHICFGTWTVDDYDIESGDDSISLGAEPTDPYVAADPYPVKGVRIGQGRCVSKLITCLKMYVQAASPASLTVEDVQVDGMTGQSKNNACIWLNDLRGGVAGAGQIKRIKVRGQFVIGDSPTTASSAFSGLTRAVAVTNADDLDIDVGVEYLQDASAVAGWRLAYVEQSRSPHVKIRCTNLPKSGGFQFVSCVRPSISGSEVTASSTTSTALLILTDSLDTQVDDARLLNMPNNGSIILVNTGTAAGTTILAHGGKWSHVAGATLGLVLNIATAASCAFVEAKNVDLRNAYLDTASTPPRPFGSNFGSITAYDVADCPGLLSRVRNNLTFGAATTSLSTTTGAHLEQISPRQVNLVAFTSDPLLSKNFWIDNQGPNGFRFNYTPAPGGAGFTGYSIVDVGRKPAT